MNSALFDDVQRGGTGFLRRAVKVKVRQVRGGST